MKLSRYEKMWLHEQEDRRLAKERAEKVVDGWIEKWMRKFSSKAILDNSTQLKDK